MNISPLWFWPGLGWLMARLQNQKLNTLLHSTWKFECHFNAAQETKKAIYECTELKYVETKCLSTESQRHAGSLVEVFISYKSETVICEVPFIFFPGVLSSASMHQQCTQDCGELCSSCMGTVVRVWRLINKVGRQLISERSRFLRDSRTAITHRCCQRKLMQPLRHSWDLRWDFMVIQVMLESNIWWISAALELQWRSWVGGRLDVNIVKDSLLTTPDCFHLISGTSKIHYRLTRA